VSDAAVVLGPMMLFWSIPLLPLLYAAIVETLVWATEALRPAGWTVRTAVPSADGGHG
jgi:hypothetical protein